MELADDATQRLFPSQRGTAGRAIFSVQRLGERLYIDARLAEDTLKRARSDAAVGGHGDVERVFCESNVRTALPHNCETKPLQRANPCAPETLRGSFTQAARARRQRNEGEWTRALRLPQNGTPPPRGYSLAIHPRSHLAC